MKKTCIECGDEFAGRSDKKFCSDACRNSFNNRLNSDENNLVRNTNNILRKNRRILKNIITGLKTRAADKSKMLADGFNFRYHTEHFTTRAGKTYVFCYEYGYLSLEEDRYMIVKKD